MWRIGTPPFDNAWQPWMQKFSSQQGKYPTSNDAQHAAPAKPANDDSGKC